MLKPLLLTLALAATLPAAAAAELRVAIAGRPDLVLDLPEGWRHQLTRPGADAAPTLLLESPKAGDFRVEIVASASAPGTKPPTAAATAAELRRRVQAEADAEAPKAGEPKPVLLDLDASGKSGYFFSATEKSPGADGYEHLTQGALGIDELRIDFTIRSHGDPKAATDAALQMLRSVRRAPAAAGGKSTG